ncbi:FAD-linked sulfhydryl oxidase ALR [Tirmania nivea]|nr:FAD-linked sulfhydryl oxidase ALR [Tirmania nivea]
MAEILELQEEQNIHPPKEKQEATGTIAPAASSGDQAATGHQKYPKGVVLGKDGKPCRSCTSAADWIRLARSSNKPGASTTHTTSTNTTTITAPTGQLTTTSSEECPPDVQVLGRSTWTFLHTLSANYPKNPTQEEQSDMKQFMRLFGKLYPCWVCAEDFKEWMERPENRLELAGEEGMENGQEGGKKGERDLLARRFGRAVTRVGEKKESNVNGARAGSGGKGGNWLDSRERFGLWMCMAHNAVNTKLGKPEFDCRKWEERWRTGCGVGEDVD